MSRAERPPSFSFYPADWLADAAVEAMSFDEQGRYWRAVCMSWQTNHPGIALEDQWRRWCRYASREWPKHRSALAAAFVLCPDEVWIQKRTVETRLEQLARRSAAQAGAAKTNGKRWGGVAERHVERPDSDRIASRSTAAPSSSLRNTERPTAFEVPAYVHGYELDPGPAFSDLEDMLASFRATVGLDYK